MVAAVSSGRPGPWCEDTARACRTASPALALPVADALDAVAARALAVPSIVVTGPVSSGKSTLVNALVGRRVAPTGAGECTRLVARYVRGPADRLDVVLTDGTHRPLPLAEGGRVPAAVGDRLGVAAADVDHLVVTLTSDALDGLTVVDTPGTGSARRPGRPHGAVPTTSLPGTSLPTNALPAPDAAEAALVVLPPSARADEVDRLAEAARAGPAGVVAVLGRADTVGSARDAETVAAVLGRRLGDRLGPVTPVVGLLAETATTGALRAEDRHALAALAQADPAAVAPALADPELFLAADLPVGVPARTRLIELLDRRGITVAVDLLRERPGAGLGEVAAALLAASGLATVTDRLRDGVRARADLLATAAAERRVAALAAQEHRVALRVAADRTGDPRADRDAAVLADLLEALRVRPLHLDLDLLAADARRAAGAVDLPDELAADLADLGRTAAGRAGAADLAGRLALTEDELAAHAARRAAAWRSYAGWGTPPHRAEVAHTVHRAWARMWTELTA